MENQDSQLLEKLKRRHKQLQDDRNTWIPHWKDIKDHLVAHRGMFISQGQKPNRGDKIHNNILDNTGWRAMRVLIAGMQGGLTSPARPWFNLKIEGREDLMENGAVRSWLHETEKRMYAVFSRSNFYATIKDVYCDEAGFGTAVLTIDEDPEYTVRFKVYQCGEYCLAEGPNGIVNTLYRRYWQTYEQVVKKFGLNNVSHSIKTTVDRHPDKWTEIVHVVEPNHNRNYELFNNQNMPYRSIFYENKFDHILSQSGFQEKSFAAPRWDMSTGAYGYSIGMEALPDVKQLQEMVYSRTRAMHKLNDPPTVKPTGFKRRLNINPAGENWADPKVAEGIKSLYDIKPDITAITAAIDEQRIHIREALYNDLFLMLQDRNPATATEVREMQQEKLLLLGPVIERQFFELLDPTINRIYNIMLRKGEVPEWPEELNEAPLGVEYVSLLAQAQKLLGTQSINALTGFTGTLAEFNPEVLDKIDFDEAVDQYADMTGAPPKIVRSDDKVAAIRKARAEAQQVEQQQVEQTQMLEGAKTLSETSLEGDNALSELRSSMEGV